MSIGISNDTENLWKTSSRRKWDESVWHVSNLAICSFFMYVRQLRTVKRFGQHFFVNKVKTSLFWTLWYITNCDVGGNSNCFISRKSKFAQNFVARFVPNFFPVVIFLDPHQKIISEKKWFYCDYWSKNWFKVFEHKTNSAI